MHPEMADPTGFLSDCYTENPTDGLIRASASGCLDTVQTLLDLGTHRGKDEIVRRALCAAVCSGHAACVEALLDAKADPTHTCTRHGLTAFMEALRGNHMEIVSMLMARCKVNLNQVDFNNSTTLMYTALTGNFSAAKIFLKHGRPNLPYQVDLCKETVISYAAINGHQGYLRQLMTRISFKDELVNAAAHNRPFDVKHYLESGHDPNAKDFGGLSALTICAMMGHHQSLDQILRLGSVSVDVNQKDPTGRTPLAYAAACGSYECMESLFLHGADGQMMTRALETLVILVARNGSVRCLDLILRVLLRGPRSLLSSIAGFDYRSRDDPSHPSNLLPDGNDYDMPQSTFLNILESFDLNGKNALMYASENGHLNIARVLVDTGVRIDSHSLVTFRSALIGAAAQGQVHVVSWLIGRGADIHFRDFDNNSAIFHAAENGRQACVQVLLQAGASACLFVGYVLYQSAAYVALINGHMECFQQLVSSMTPKKLRISDINDIDAVLNAAKVGSIPAIRCLLRAGLHLNSRDVKGNTPLMYATAGCHFKCMRFLLEEMRISVNDTNDLGLNALGMAVAYNLPNPIVQYLINWNSDVNAFNRFVGYSPLIFACQNNNAAQTRLLLSSNVNVTHKDRYGNTALTHAAKLGHEAPVAILLDYEMRRGMNLLDFDHMSALSHAFYNFHQDVIHRFLTLGIFHWSWYQPIVTHIHWQGRVVVNSLLLAGISPGSFGDQLCAGQYSSPLLLAKEENDHATVQYILRNLYFTTTDYRTILKNGSDIVLDQRLVDSSLGVMEGSLSRNPLSLATLSFLVVSTAIGGHCGTRSRVPAVYALPLPQTLQKKLAFEETQKLDFKHCDRWQDFVVV